MKPMFKFISIEEAVKMPKLPFYKMLLRSAQKYPSIKRDSIISEIKSVFREKRNTTDPLEIQKEVEMGLSALREFGKYTHLDSKQTNWTINLD
jgi:hypothetical protein